MSIHIARSRPSNEAIYMHAISTSNKANSENRYSISSSYRSAHLPRFSSIKELSETPMKPDASMSSPEALLANIKATTHATLTTTASRDYDALVALRSRDFRFQALPLSLGQPELDNAHFRELWFGLLLKIFAELEVCPLATKRCVSS